MGKEKGKDMEEEARKAEKIERKKEKDKQYRRDKRHEKAAAKKESNGRNGIGNLNKPKPSADNANIDAPPGFKAKKRAGVEPPPGFKEPAPKKQKTVTDEEYNELSETKQRELRTVFLSNLSYEVDDDRIRDTMASSGPIVEVRLIKKPDGKSKGYAFVE